MRVFINHAGFMVAANHHPNKVRLMDLNHSYGRPPEEIEPGTLHIKNQHVVTKHGDEICNGTLCADQNGRSSSGSSFPPSTYRTSDGEEYYKFQYFQVGGFYEIQIVSQPGYKGRDSSSHVSHRLPSSRGGSIICIGSAYRPKTMDKAVKISMDWAECTHVYIKTGVTMDRQIAKRSHVNTKKNEPQKPVPGISGFLNWIFN